MTTNSNTNSPAKRSRGSRVFLLVAGTFAGLMAVGLIGLGGLALWGDSQKDDQGYLTTDSRHFAAGTHALATENLDVDLDGAERLLDAGLFGDVRVDVEPRSGQPVFVGIARTGDLASYLDDVSRTNVTDVSWDPFDASYESQAGDRRPDAPGAERIWAASAEGAGPQTLDWEVEDGDWSIVVMNADGSSGVDADISAGANVPHLSTIGWSALGGGTVLLLTSVALSVLGMRPPRQRPRTAHAAGLAPTAG